MGLNLSSRQRLLAAINGEEPDHVPLVPSFIGPWKNEYWKGRDLLKDMLQLGLDQQISLGAPYGLHPDVRVRLWKERPPGEKYPLLFKVYETPAGELRQVAVQTEDWPHGDDIPIFSDFVAAGGRSREYLIKGPQDLEKFRCLMWEPSQEQIEKFHERARRTKAYADRYGLLVNGIGGFGGTFLGTICGFQNQVKWAIRCPEFVREMLEIVHKWDLRRVRLLLEEYVDIITRDGWYESPVFWSVKGFKEFLEPLIREEIALVHDAGLRFRYVVTMAILSIADTLRDLDVDVLFGIDPFAEKVSPQIIRRKLGYDMCLWGGIGEAVTFEQSTAQELRRAIIDVTKAFAPGGGFIMSTIGSILRREPWQINGPVMIETWQKFGKYPIKG